MVGETDSGIDLLDSFGGFTGNECWLLRDPLFGGITSPPTNQYVPPECTFTDEETSPTKLFEPDPLATIITFAEAVPDVGTSPLSKEFMATEVFQNLRHTSTPKTPVLSTSVGAVEEKARKRIKFNSLEEQFARSWQVLHDITDEQNVQGDSFVRLTDIGKEKKTETESPPHRTPVRRKVPILRGNARRNSEREEEELRAAIAVAVTPEAAAASLGPNGLQEFLYPEKSATVREMDKWLYYTGFTDYSLLVRLISHLAVPPRHGLSSFQILMMTMMRVRCDLDWRDLGFRFRVFEPAVFDMVHSTLGLLASALENLLPWRSGRPRSPGIFLAQPIAFRAEDGAPRQIMAIISQQAIEEICCPMSVSSNFMTSLSSLRSILKPGDVLAVRGLSRQPRPTFLTINQSGVFSLAPSPPPDFLPAAAAVADSLKRYRLILSNPIMTDVNMYNLMITLASFTNVNRLGISEAKLKLIHRLSSTWVDQGPYPHFDIRKNS